MWVCRQGRHCTSYRQRESAGCSNRLRLRLGKPAAFHGEICLLVRLACLARLACLFDEIGLFDEICLFGEIGMLVRLVCW